MRVLITGGAGFIGANLVRRLLEDGHNITVIDNLSTGYRSNLDGLDVDLHEDDILDKTAVTKAARGCSAVVHLAARASVPRSIADPVLTNDINVNGTINVLEAARSNDAYVVFASSSSVYGANRQLPKNEDMRPQPVSPYAVSKLAGESYVLAYQAVYDMPALAFRFFNVYGPLQAAGHAYAAVVPAFLANMLAGQPLTVYGDGTQSRDFTSVGSVVEVLSSAVAGQVASPDPVNLAFGTTTTLLELITLMSDITGVEPAVEHVAPRAGDVRASQADNGRLIKLFPAARPEPLTTGLEKTLSWFRAGQHEQQ